MDRETLRLIIIGIIAESHGADPSKPFDMNLVKLTQSTAEKIMQRVDEHVKSELHEQFMNDNP